MTAFTICFLLINCLLLMCLPRSRAMLPLLAGACYVTPDQRIFVGSLMFNVPRILIAFGVLRVLARGERIDGGMNALDKLVGAWVGSIVLVSPFHGGPGAGPVFALSLAYTICGAYYLTRIFVQSPEQVPYQISLLALLLAPIGVEMLLEQITGRNLFALIGTIPEVVGARNDRFRAQGAFPHAILAGTIGATCCPLFFGIWRQSPRFAALGIAASVLIVLTSASSGPILSLACGLGALLLWYVRNRTRQLVWGFVGLYIILSMAMNRPVYYLIASIDLVGGSTGWYRARLIQAAIENLSEWWLVGTDYTRHWIAGGSNVVENHVDLTNNYIYYGTVAGLVGVLLLISLFIYSFLCVGEYVKASPEDDGTRPFLAWSVGCALFSHFVTGLSVNYFGQSMVFLFATVAFAATFKASFSPSVNTCCGKITC